MPSATDSGKTGTLTSTVAPFAVAGAGSGACAGLAAGVEATAPSLIRMITCCASTVSPTSTRISLMVPSTLVGTSNTTFSVSMSTKLSSTETLSPTLT